MSTIGRNARIQMFAKVVDTFVDRCLWQVIPDLLCEKLIKNSQPFGKNARKPQGGLDFFDSHCMLPCFRLLVQILWPNCKTLVFRSRYNSQCCMYVVYIRAVNFHNNFDTVTAFQRSNHVKHAMYETLCTHTSITVLFCAILWRNTAVQCGPDLASRTMSTPS